jgi:hypothetical protein
MGPFGTMRQRGWVRPAIAVTLGLLATGLGHIYLRRWRRALVWIGSVLFISVFVIPPEAAATNLTVTAISGGEADLAVIAPIVGIGIASVADVYMLARNEQATPTEPAAATCPACGRPVDAELGFCQWCTTELSEA